MSRADSIFYAAVAGLVGGIFIRSFADWGGALTTLVGLLALCFFLLRFTKPLLAVFLFAAAVGMLRYDFADQAGPQHAFDAHLGAAVTIQGVVQSEPDLREASTHLVIEADKTKILLIVNREPAFAYGDKIEAQGILKRPENFTDELTLRKVDYASYLAKDDIYYEMIRPKVTLIAHGEGNWLLEKLFVFKNAFLANIGRVIPEPHAALLGGLVVGAKHSLGKELLADFRTVGVIHIVVLSGYNITLIARFVELLFSRLRRNLRLLLAAGAMILFALMVGASATVVRATVMALLALLARGAGRIYAVTRALLIAGVLMLLHNPKILVFDTSFQLSFLATVGLIYLSPLIEPKVQWVTERLHIREVVIATVATQLFVLPFLLYKTGIFSLVSLPVNILILSAIPATMLLGFLVGMVGFVSLTLSLPFAYGAYALLAYLLAVVEWSAQLPFASVALASFPLALAVVWYGVYLALFIRSRRPHSG